MRLDRRESKTSLKTSSPNKEPWIDIFSYFYLKHNNNNNNNIIIINTLFKEGNYS